MNNNSFNRGRQLSLAREFRGYTQKELSDNINGVTHGHISKFEKGFEGVISDDKLK